MQLFFHHYLPRKKTEEEILIFMSIPLLRREAEMRMAELLLLKVFPFILLLLSRKDYPSDYVLIATVVKIWREKITYLLLCEVLFSDKYRTIILDI